MKIIVLAGGESPERAVSLRSGTAAAAALIKKGHSVALIDTLYGAPKDVNYCREHSHLPDIAALRRSFTPSAPIHPTVLPICEGADAVFIALHGGVGENGILQHELEKRGIRYCGSDSLSCAAAMDKLESKRRYLSAGIATPEYTVAKRGCSYIAPAYPCVVKPADGGSSIGVSFVYSKNELCKAVEKALEVSETAIIETMIEGTELSVSILENSPLAVTEIVPVGKHYDYESKYSKGGAREITPARLSGYLYGEAMRIGEKAHRALGLKNFSRTDLILRDGRFYTLETNALPGLTETSILPSAAASAGISFPELCERMLK